MKKRTKTEVIKDVLEAHGYVSNVVAVMGGYGIRETRLASTIDILRKKGMVIESKIRKDEDGNYRDCVYTLVKEDGK